ncbi:protein phosphatase CheZ [endosymbiont of Lamellibrachia barhami]|uniref:protein phosphatase CheZ n=1 Tax=endosymbiont of Lamellibrachia barhami TaxID=205975 RepID=UPI0015B1E1A3|nr:protein phosphatase CheZ [endosymbiont of Lamellibrachia barhami]
MQEQTETGQTRLEMARALVAHLEAGENEDADRVIGELAEIKENKLFTEVGRLTRELHEAINGFLLDSRVSEMTQVDIPDAKERLNYVISMTEQSADRTLTAVEESLPMVEALDKQAGELLAEWDKFRSRLLTKDDFRGLSDELAAFLQQTQSHSKSLHDNLSDVLMAQDFQDLTGQIIRKVIELVHDVEEKLVKLVRITGGKLEVRKKLDDPTVLEGPVVPGVEQGDVVTNQDDVDDLLSSLGF